MHLPTTITAALAATAAADVLDVIYKREFNDPYEGIYVNGFWSNDWGEAFAPNIGPRCRNPGVPGVVDACFGYEPNCRAHFWTTTGAKRCFKQTNILKHVPLCYHYSSCDRVFHRWLETACTW